jgi:hypothetical protein
VGQKEGATSNQQVETFTWIALLLRRSAPTLVSLHHAAVGSHVTHVPAHRARHLTVVCAHVAHTLQHKKRDIQLSKRAK